MLSSLLKDGFSGCKILGWQHFEHTISLPLASVVSDKHSAVDLLRKTFESWTHCWALCLLRGHFIYGVSEEQFTLTRCPGADSTLVMQFHLSEETSKALSARPIKHFT